MLSVRFLSRHEIYKRFSSGDLISGLNRKVSVRSKDPQEDARNPREAEKKQGKEEKERDAFDKVRGMDSSAVSP